MEWILQQTRIQEKVAIPRNTNYRNTIHSYKMDMARLKYVKLWNPFLNYTYSFLSEGVNFGLA